MVVYTSLKTNISGSWYFDSGCSRHMTGDKNVLTDYVNLKGGKVTYGGGAKGNILGKGVLNVVEFPKLQNVLHVDGLTANLISIGQLCDDGMFVKFDKNTCAVYDETTRLEPRFPCNFSEVRARLLPEDKSHEVRVQLPRPGKYIRLGSEPSSPRRTTQ